MGEKIAMSGAELLMVRKALIEFLTEWKVTVSGPAEDLRYGPLATKADAFIESVVDLAVKRMRADVREPSHVK